MKLITIILLFPIFSFSQEYYLVYCNSYKTSFEEKGAAITIYIKNDSIRTYVPEAGYIWWKIEKTFYQNTIKGTNLIQSGRYELSYKGHFSILIIKEHAVGQMILLRGDPTLIFTIQFTVNQKIKPK